MPDDAPFPMLTRGCTTRGCCLTALATTRTCSISSPDGSAIASAPNAQRPRTHALHLSDGEATALAAHLAALPRRLRTAANAARLAARRCSLVELKELVLEWPTTKLQIDEHEIADHAARDQARQRVRGCSSIDSAYPDPLVVYSDAELAGVIAEAVGLDLSDLAQRRRAQQQAQLACRRLAAIVAYQASARLGDPNDAADSSDPSAPALPDDCRPDSRGDLTELLRDLADERWPITATMTDSLTAVC